jgi:hypothetical protein
LCNVFRPTRRPLGANELGKVENRKAHIEAVDLHRVRERVRERADTGHAIENVDVPSCVVRVMSGVVRS